MAAKKKHPYFFIEAIIGKFKSFKQKRKIATKIEAMRCRKTNANVVNRRRNWMGSSEYRETCCIKSGEEVIFYERIYGKRFFIGK